MAGSRPGEPLDHVLTHLARLDLLIRRELRRLRRTQGHKADEEFRGLYLSDEEVDALLARSISPSALLSPPSPPDEGLEGAIASIEGQIIALEHAAKGRGVDLPLARLGRLFGLSPMDQSILVFCLAAEVDLKYEKLFGYLQDDVTKKRPTVDLVTRLLCATVEQKLAARAHFEPGAPLLYWDLISLHDDPGSRRPVLPARYVKLDDRIAGYVMGSQELDHRLTPWVSDQRPAEAGTIAPDALDRLAGWTTAWETRWGGMSPVLLIHGRYGTGKRSAARMVASSLGRPLLMLRAPELMGSDLGIERAMQLAAREARLTGSVLGWSETDLLLQGEGGLERESRTFVRTLSHGTEPVILLAEKGWEPTRSLLDRPFLRIELPEPSYTRRRSLWAGGLGQGEKGLSEQELSALASRFRLTPGQIRDALGRARALAWSRDPSNGHLTAADLDAACRGQAQHRLGSLARKIEPHYSWDDIVLAKSQLATLRLINTTVRHRPTVYGDWGFDRKLAMGKGLIALFAGPTGTGKTMAADIIAGDLKLDLYKVDLAGVVSKYIGETEKNLERIFGEAQDSNAILFFDEADALFGKRSEVKDAHDRYANIEIAYLLQRTEEYSGLVILASNVKKNMDEAFVRRLHFVVDFPFPEEPERLEIWRRTFPPEAPVADDIDLPFLARKLRLAGGNIRNVILTAAFLAADEGLPIAMSHLIRGASYEFQKMGKLLVEGDFERYFELVGS